MDVSKTSERNPDLDLLANGDLKVTFGGSKMKVSVTPPRPAEDPGLLDPGDEELT